MLIAKATEATLVADVDWSVIFLFIADDVAIISVPTPNLMLHGNDITYLGGTLIIVGTIYYIHDTFTFLEFFATAGA